MLLDPVRALRSNTPVLMVGFLAGREVVVVNGSVHNIEGMASLGSTGSMIYLEIGYNGNNHD